MKDAIKIAIEALQANQKSWKTLADSGDAGNWKAEEQPVWRQTEDALSIMRGLAEDAEPKLLGATCVCGRSMTVTTSPQAAQTELKSESSAQAAQAPARLPGEGKTIEALAPFDVNAGDSNSVVSQNQRNVDVKTEEQEREAFEAEFDQLCKDYSIYGLIEARLCKVFFEAGRTGSKP